MTREEFLLDPVKAYWTEDVTVPLEWIRAAWAIQPFRDNATYEIVRSVRKNGDFFIVPHWMATLPAILSSGEILELYLAIRIGSHRLEDEWREEFVAAFAAHADHLPPPGSFDQD